MNDIVTKSESWGELSEAMRTLPNQRWRDFVHHYCRKVGRGAAVGAYRAAGFGVGSSKRNQAIEASRLLHDERVIRAVAEESRKVLRAGQPEAVNTVYEIMRDPNHKDRLRASLAVLDRTDPLTTHSHIDITHKVLNADDESLEELRAARLLGASREKLIELFGSNELPRLEALEARRAEQAKLIEGKVIENGNE